MATLIESKYLSLGTAAKDLNARKLPAYFADPTYYTPVAIGTEGADQVSAHLNGINTALGGRLLLSGGTLTGALSIGASGSSGNSLICTGSIRIGSNIQSAFTAGAGSLKWNGSALLYSNGSEWKSMASVQAVAINVVDFDVTNPSGQSIFSTGQDLSGSSVLVYEEGIARREGVDYSVSGSDIIFSYSVKQGQWVSVHVSNADTTAMDFDTAVNGETVFDVGTVLAGKSVQVYEEGILRRIGAAKDYTISGTTVVFNYTVIGNTWVRILVF
jgi:hypothetical protein